MYTIYLDDQLIYTPGNADLAVIGPELDLELNSAGTLEFTLPGTHPFYSAPVKMLSRVEVWRNDEMLFCGRIVDESIDFYKRKTLTCEGELAFLNDSIQRPGEYHDMTAREYLEMLIAAHNEQVEADKQFTVGIVTVGTGETLFRYTNYNSTMQEIKEDLVDDLGGYLRVRHQDGVRYLDYVELVDYGVTNDQAIRFGTNLLDFTQDMDVTDIATVIIPLGERLEESPIEALDMRLTIEDVNGGKDYIESEEAVATYGRITKTVIWDDVTVAANLLSKGEKYLSDTQWDEVRLEADAVDMNLTDAEMDAFHLGDQLRVVSDPHGLDRYFPLESMKLKLDAPESNSYSLGITTSPSLIGQLVTQQDVSTQLGSLSAALSSRTAAAIDNVSNEVLQEARDIATMLINAATHGYVIVEPDEILIMDTDDKETAKRVWRWNLNGLGYSSTGYYGTFGTAITMDGSIVADYIATGTMYADRIKGGTLTLGGSNNTDGQMTVLNASGKEVGSFSKDGLTATAGTISGWTIGSKALYNGTDSMSSETNGIYIGTDGIRNYSKSYQEYLNITGAELTNGNYTGSYSRLIPAGIESYYYNEYAGLLRGDSHNNVLGMYLTSQDNVVVGIKSSNNIIVYHHTIRANSSPPHYFYGAAQFSSTVTCTTLYETSDLELKTDVKDIDGSTSFLDRLEPVSFSYKDDGSGKIHFGVTYQNVSDALEAVGIAPEESGIVSSIEDDDGNVYGTVAYDELIAPMIHEIQTLKAEMQELKEKIARLEGT